MHIKTHKMNKNDYVEIATLHCNHINQGFLATLGVPFLCLLYEAIDRANESVLIVERVDDKVVGFVAGTSGLGRIYLQLLFRPFRLINSLKSCLLSTSKIYKIIEILLISKKSNNSSDMPKHELLSIVVNPVYQGGDHAVNLFNGLCGYFREEGIRSFRIVVGSNLDKAHSFYRKMGSLPVEEVQVHKDVESVVYVKKLD